MFGDKFLFLRRWWIGLKIIADLKACVNYVKGRVLDVGCGKKPYLNSLEDHCEYCIGIDLPNTASGVPKADVYGTGLALPFKDGSFDTVLCTQVIEHVTEPEMLLKEIFRVVSEGGYVILTAPLMNALHDEPKDFWRFTKYGLRYLFDKVGFKSISVEAQGGFWAMMAQMYDFYFTDRVSFGNSKVNHIVFAIIRLCLGPFYLLDQCFLEDRYTMNYLVVAAKPRLD